MTMATRYGRVAEDLRRRIRSGELLAGDRLPAEKDLAVQYGVSTPTVRQALEVLRDDGLVEKHHGVGTFIRILPHKITYMSGRSRGTWVPEVGLQVRVSAAEIAAHESLAPLLQVPAGTPLTEFVYLSRRDDAPYSLARVYVPRSFAELGPPRQNSSPWGDDIRAGLASAGIHLATTVERVTARPPTEEEADLLRLPARASVLAIERTSTDIDGHVVEGALFTLPGDRVEAVFTTQLTPSEELETAFHD